ncbi:MAG: hypothetical protein IPJ65_28350 [Archangiaceae bacterium]|nr:hypothetical protein [Archangiaceae bacterium]
MISAACSTGQAPWVSPGGGSGGGGSAGGSGGGGVTPDAGAPDAGQVMNPDAGMLDSGMRDAGVRDAGPTDSGVRDSGVRDAGVRDAGPADLIGFASDGGTAMVEWRNFDSQWCDVQRGCAKAGDRALLRFDFKIANIGERAIDLTTPANQSLLTESCGGQPKTTLKQFADWELLAGGAPVAAGSSDVHCLADDEAMNGTTKGVFTCNAQGLSSQFLSHQPADGICSWPDVSGLDAGQYTLHVKLNASGTVPEARLDNNDFTLPVSLPDTRCRGSWCGSTCCPPNTPCNPSGQGCGLPDLTVDQGLMASTAHFELLNLNMWNCAVQEHCVGGPGNRFVLRFSVSTPNVGDGDFYIGDPAQNPRASWSPCHMHYHYNDYATYQLVDLDGGLVVSGHKQAFCAFDDDQVSPDAGPAKYTCQNQGISVGWADTYNDYLECQWVDVTGVAPGNYMLEVIVNPNHVIAEKDYANNIARVPVTVPP